MNASRLTSTTSTHTSSTASIPVSRCVCIRNKAVPLTLVDSQEINTWQLEDTIECHLQGDDDDPDEEEEEGQVVHIRVRDDCHWLGCRSPVLRERTILGIWEESVSKDTTPTDQDDQDDQDDQKQDQSSRVRVSIYTAKHSDAETALCPCVIPLSEWIRQPMKKVDDHVDLPVPVPVQLTPSANPPTPIRLDWIDLREWQQEQSSFLEKPADVCHFLRSLLGTSNSASPWVDKNRNSIAVTSKEQESHQEQEPQVIAVVLSSSTPPKALNDFRTSNMAPSYFLHSTSKLYLPRNNTTWILSDTNTTDTTASTYSFDDLEQANLLVFRRLAPRDHLTPARIRSSEDVDVSADHEPLPDGCLWETYYNAPPTSDDNHPMNKNHSPQLTLYRPLGPPYVSHKQDYPELLEPLLKLENINAIRTEAISIPQWTAWPETQHYNSTAASNEDGSAETPSWNVFPLVHCFPANLLQNRKWIETTSAFCPRTTALLKEHLGDTLRTALFSRLDAEATLEAHTGWEDLANHVIRVHLPLIVPPGNLCGAWVDGCGETLQEGRFLCFDDAKVHRAYNYSPDQARIILILDLARPDHLPRGTATGGHTEELDKFIDQLV